MPAMLPPDYHGGRYDGSVQNSDLSGKEFDDIVSRVEKVHQRWNNRLTFPITKLSECYLGGHVGIHLDCSFRGSDVFGQGKFSISIANYSDDVLGTGASGEFKVCAGVNDNEFPVLIESVHIVNDAERIIDRVAPSLVWLESFDDSENVGIRNALYFSVVSAQFVFRKRFVPKNRELNGGVVVASRLRAGEVPHDMIQAGAQMVHDLTGKDTESLRNRQCFVIVNRFLPALRVWLGNSWVLAFTEELGDFIVEIDDTLIGPL